MVFISLLAILLLIMHESDHWITVKEAARLSGYTSAHISRWAQRGKFIAEKSGRNWLVDYPSLKNFLKTNKQELGLKKVSLSLQRKEELKNKSKLIYIRLIDIEAITLSLVLVFLGALSGILIFSSLNYGSNVSDIRLGLLYIVENLKIAIPLDQTAVALLSLFD